MAGRGPGPPAPRRHGAAEGRRQILATAAFLATRAIPLNFVWESHHSEYLYRYHEVPTSRYVPMTTCAAAMDAVLVLVLCAGTALVSRDGHWIRRETPRRLGVFVALGLSLSAGIEVKGVYLLNQWFCLAAMPTVFGVGLSPLVQLATTGLLAVAVTRRLLVPRCREVSARSPHPDGESR